MDNKNLFQPKQSHIEGDVFDNHSLSNEKISDLLKIQKSYTLEKISKCNEFTSQYQLSLTKKDMENLINCQQDELKYTGRIQFGESILPKLIFEFCDSQYISQDNYVQILNELQEIFYYFKNETMDEMSDDELIQGMKEYYNTECQGSLEYLKSNFLDDMVGGSKYLKGLYGDEILEASDEMEEK